MSKVRRLPIIDPNYIASRRAYKKLGTILEHLTETIDPTVNEIRITFSQYPSAVNIRIFRHCFQFNVAPVLVWELCWNQYFNSKILMARELLIPGAEW